MSNILLKALNQCADKFQQYVEHHEKNGHSEKAINNKLMVSMIREAIANYDDFEKNSHWTDKHIKIVNDEIIAYDEAGLEHGKYKTFNEARDALVTYSFSLGGKLKGIPIRIIEIDQHLVDLKRVQVVSPLDKGKFSLTMVSGIDAHCSDAKMYEGIKQAYRDYMKWEQGLDVPSVTTVKAVGDIISLKSEVGQVKPECKIVPIEITKEYFSYYIGTWNLASVYKNGLNQFVISFHFNLVSDNSIELLQARYDTMAQADSVARETITSYYNRLFA